MRIIEQLVYKIIGDTAGAEKALETISKKMDTVGKIAKVAIGGVTVGAIVETIKKLGDLAIESSVALDRVDKLSQKIGMSRQGFQEWDFVLAQSGASIDGLQMSMKTLATQAEAAGSGAGESAEMFKRLGVEITDVNGKTKDQEKLFNEVFLALSDMESETERTAIAARLLGRSATELAPALNTSREAIEGLKDQAHSLGLVYEDDLVDAGVRLGDNISSLTKSFAAFKTKALAPVLSTIVLVTDKMLGQDSASVKLQGALDKVKKTTEDYKAAQEHAASATDLLSEAMVAQARAQAAAATNELIQLWASSGAEFGKLQRKLETSNRDIEAFGKTLAFDKKQFEQLSKAAKAFGLDIEDAMGMSTQALAEYIQAQNAGMKQAAALEKAYNLAPAIKNYAASISVAIQLDRDRADINAKLADIESDRARTITGLAQAVASGDVYILEYIKHDKELYDAIQKSVDILHEQEIGIELAKKRFTDLRDVTQSAVETEMRKTEIDLKSAQGTQKLAELNEYLKLLRERNNELLVEQARKEDELQKKEEARTQIYEEAIKATENYVSISEVLGDAFDLNSKQSSAYQNAIEALVETGLTKADDRVADLLDRFTALNAVQGDLTDEQKKQLDITTRLNDVNVRAEATYQLTGDRLSYLRQIASAAQTALVDLILVGQESSEQYSKLNAEYVGYISEIETLTEKQDTQIDKEKLINDILEKTRRELSNAATETEILGTGAELTAMQIGVLTSNIKSLISLGLGPSDDAVKNLVVDLHELQAALSDTVDIELETINIQVLVRRQLDALDKEAQAYGESQGDAAKKTAVLQKAITQLISLGVDPASNAVQSYVRQISELTDVEDASAKVEADRTRIYLDAISAMKTYLDIAAVVGDTYDVNSKQVSKLRSALELLVTSGLDETDYRVRALKEQLDQLGVAESALEIRTARQLEIANKLNTVLEKNNATYEITNDELTLVRQNISATEDALVSLILVGAKNEQQFRNYQEQLDTLKERQAELAKTVGDSVEKDILKAEVLTKVEDKLARAKIEAEALGAEFNNESAQIAILTAGIRELIELGFTVADEEMKKLIVRIEGLTVAVNPAINAIDKYNEAMTKAGYAADITGDREAYLRTVISETETAMVSLLMNGVDPVNDGYQKLAGKLELVKKELIELNAEGNLFKRWVIENHEALDTTVDLMMQVNSLTRIQGQIIAAQMQERLQQIDEELKAKLEAEGVQEETTIERLKNELKVAIRAGNEKIAKEKEVELKRARLEEEFAEKKRRIQREEAVKQKEYAIFQALIDTASAIIRAMPNPFLMTAAELVGAQQLALIRARPIPSFDTGAIRIDRDKAAIVHKDEMILPPALSEQARREGINIAPKGSGESIHLQVLMDSRPIIDTTVRGINSGQYGKIDARVVK